jgi:hypothetical protein
MGNTITITGPAERVFAAVLELTAEDGTTQPNWYVKDAGNPKAVELAPLHELPPSTVGPDDLTIADEENE